MDQAEEAPIHILSFLSYTYLIELGTQNLMPVHPRSPISPIAECLRILRDKANAVPDTRIYSRYLDEP
ncbi:hypothetical protein M405DRAFT_870563 [Rhizopogon salebrosus TDB-379]|nr:hypothetical protein M405DRAFT_870563 [Rhizopogon salebrosus TDB-379]